MPAPPRNDHVYAEKHGVPFAISFVFSYLDFISIRTTLHADENCTYSRAPKNKSGKTCPGIPKKNTYGNRGLNFPTARRKINPEKNVPEGANLHTR
jgi:hypothetical protein